MESALNPQKLLFLFFKLKKISVKGSRVVGGLEGVELVELQNLQDGARLLAQRRQPTFFYSLPQ